MIHNETNLEVADNSGARRVQCIKVLGGSKRKFASVGDIIIVSIKEAIPKGFTRVLGKLAELSDSGIKIYFFGVWKLLFI